MSRLLPRNKINYILQQMVVFSFVCLMAFFIFFVSYDFKLLRIGIQTFTVLTVVLYEIIIHLIKSVRKNKSIEDDKDNQKYYNEHFLWFNILLLIDIIFIVSLISQVFKNINIIFFLIIGITIFSIISNFVKPYFGIEKK